MRPIIIDMSEMSDSKEVYDSRPNRFLAYTIYAIAGACLIALIWMEIFHIDNVVKSNGIFRTSDDCMSVSSLVAGEIVSCDVADGTYVKEGDVLAQIKINDSEVENWNNLGEKLEALEAYQQYLSGNHKALDGQKENAYYTEILNRKNLLEKNISVNAGDKTAQVGVYQNTIDNNRVDVMTYEQKINDYKLAETCIYQRINSFGDDKPYFKSMVDSYISNYSLTSSDYDSKIMSLENQMNAQGDGEIGQVGDVDNVSSVQSLKDEKTRVLTNMELEQIAAIESQIESTRRTVQSLQGTISSAQSEMNSINTANSKDVKDLQVLTEQANLAKEIEECKTSKMQYDEAFENYDDENATIAIRAKKDGYFYMVADIMDGTYIEAAKQIGAVYPKDENGYYADVYVANKDIAKLKEGQEVKFEIAAYPSSEYGYFTGEIADISKDISVDSETGSAYYIVKVRCDKDILTNKTGETGKLKNGMACQAKIIVGNESVLKYVLEKIDLID